MKEIQSQLFALQDIEYREFISKLNPAIDKENIIGIRTPKLRQLAKELNKTPEAETFLHDLPHNTLAAFRSQPRCVRLHHDFRVRRRGSVAV